jgi:putative ubiquitin-RnfH superfamily antitoxin RatB of RatAB toxin-antitoxin module
MREGAAQPSMLIEIVYAGPQTQIIAGLEVDPPATVADALRLAAADPRFTGVDLQTAAVGIFGTVVAREQVLAPGDRIEIYRELAIDPKIARRRRASAKPLSKSARS